MMVRGFVSATAVLFVTGGAVPVLAADGAAVYKAQCAKCHGEDGRADTAAAKAMKTPAVRGDAKVAATAPADLVKKIKESKKHAGLVKQLSEDDLAAAAAHVKELAGMK